MTKVVIRSGLLAIALFGATQASAQLATRANGPVTQNGKANVIAATVVGNHSQAVAAQNSFGARKITR